MGIFSSPASLSPELEPIFRVGREKGQPQFCLRAAEKHIPPLRSLLQGDEKPLIAAADFCNPGVVLITNRRAVALRKQRVEKELLPGDISDTSIGVGPQNNWSVTIRSHRSYDFRPGDLGVMLNSIFVDVGRLNRAIANEVAVTVDAVLIGG